MNVSMKDMIIIEHALQELISHDDTGQDSVKYKQVLYNIQNQRKHISGSQQETGVQPDGVRYDYDDSSDLYEQRH